MSDLLGSSGRGNGNGNGNGGNSSTSPSAPIKRPTEVMAARRARDEARRLRDDQREGQSATSEVQSAAERRAAAAGLSAGGRDSGYRSAGPSAGGFTPAATTGTTSAGEPRSTRGYDTSRPVPSPYDAGDVPAQPTRPRQGTVPPRTSSAQPRQQAQSSRSAQPSSQPRASTQGASGGGGGNGSSQPRNSSVASAFERWEILGSRFEGLVSYWLNKMERNPETGDTYKEMGRQITDLAAAGSNLFHAVVELQRLRASSERKFQRWFYETRAQQEQAKEEQARLRQALEHERLARQQQEQERSVDVQQQRAIVGYERLIQEYKRELQIAKDEAKRAWEELGRQQQTERERIYALREGIPVELGGISVVPHNGPSREPSQRTAPDTMYSSQPVPSAPSRITPSPTDTDPYSARPPNVSRAPASSSYSRGAPPAAAPTIPAASSSRGPVPAAPRTSESPSARFYSQSQGTALHSQPVASTSQAYAGSDVESDVSYDLDESGHIRLDSAGQPLYRLRSGAPTSAAGTGVMAGPSGAPLQSHVRQESATDSELEAEAIAREQMRSSEQYRGRSTAQTAQLQSTPAAHTATLESADDDDNAARYEGEEYPEDQMEWAEMQEERQHHHPSRLSAVMEEDERSRGSMSRPSRGSDMF